MRTRKEHNEYCESKGMSQKVCDETNRWMDEPSREHGGCAHREQRHTTVDCLKWAAKSATNPKEAAERFRACQTHREADRKTDKCGSSSLQE